MSNQPSIDEAAAHHHFAPVCFNRCWGLIDNRDRSAEETEDMIRLAQASLWHWTQRDECTTKHMSIGYWQLSRVYALAREAQNAQKYGQLALETSPPDEPFCVGYGFEALARAAMVARDKTTMNAYLAKAQAEAEKVTDTGDKQVLLGDLATIEL